MAKKFNKLKWTEDRPEKPGYYLWSKRLGGSPYSCSTYMFDVYADKKEYWVEGTLEMPPKGGVWACLCVFD